MYQALYRKYRPRNFDEVVGQEHITVTIKNEIASGRVGHAYLFTGSRGTGKTSCSKIFAKAVNCSNQSDGNPCGACSFCLGIDSASILDVTEIDAASNNGVDNIRQLREEANFTPTVAAYRVYIIDEVHMLSTGAFNALLKIMEDPPAHVIFILATTEAHKIPATILSRCQRFDFKRIRSEVISAQLMKVSASEGLILEEAAANLIARLAEGGMRDALSLLDVCRGETGAITVKSVSEASGLAVQGSLFEIGDAVLKRDVPGIIAVMDKVYNNSIDFEELCSQLISHYRGLMMAKAVKEAEKFVLCMDEDLARLKEQAAAYTMPQILYCLTVLQDALSRMSRTSQTRTELEMAMIKLTSPEMASSQDSQNARITRLEEAVKAGSFPQGGEYQAPITTTPADDSVANKPAQKVRVVENREAPPKTKLTEVCRFPEWSDTLDRLKSSNTALYGALVNAVAYQAGELILIDCENPIFLEIIRTNEVAKATLHEALIKAAGKDFRIGPYKKDKYKPADAQADPMESILSAAVNQGVDITIQ